MIRWFRRKGKTVPAAQGPGLQEPGGSTLETEESPSEQAAQPQKPQVEVQGKEVVDEDLASSPDLVQEEADLDETEGPRDEKVSFFRRLRDRLHKTRTQLVNRVDRLVFGKKVIDLELLDELEEVLITSDLGVHTTQTLLGAITERIQRRELSDPQKLRGQLREEIQRILSVEAPPLDLGKTRPFVINVVGVNGVGKTTTIGKLAHQFKARGLSVMLVAADTFRAAAIEQLSLWGDRVGVPVIKQKSGSDPSAVAFDAMEAAVSREVDVVLLDTAGRMHTKVNLMEELKKVQRIVARKMPGAPHETWLVLDAVTGQNALSQARLFKQEIGATGLILTKLDGTAKGGIIVAICNELQLPVRYIGIGEGMDDLRSFDPEEFTRALF
ncbi:MAG TPA: signal recognition particle-docking protein FtsY [Syntrophobacteraceae bacterium]|nr:signal recognition particle-docking protein FtsY [Syntrophobacteraceae bacterium]